MFYQQIGQFECGYAIQVGEGTKILGTTTDFGKGAMLARCRTPPTCFGRQWTFSVSATVNLNERPAISTVLGKLIPSLPVGEVRFPFKLNVNFSVLFTGTPVALRGESITS
jgi:hypothetical protein